MEEARFLLAPLGALLMCVFRYFILAVGLLPCCLGTTFGDQVIFSETFANNSAGWTLGTEWQIGSATSSGGQNYGNSDPGTDHTATADNGVAGVVIGGNAMLPLHGYFYLVSPVIDVSAYSDLQLEYYRWLNSDYTPYMHNVVDVFDGANWVNIWASGGAPGVLDASWTQQVFDLTPHINSALQVRFGHLVGSSGVFTVSSWNVDDFSLTTSVPEPCSGLVLMAGSIGLLVRQRRRRT